MFAAALGGAAILCTPAQAQSSAAAIEARIEGVFRIVPGNPVDLAVPLSRRALARRMGAQRMLPMAYAEDEAPEILSAAPAEASVVEEGSADAEGDADEDVARRPRPRPGSAENAEAESPAPAKPAIASLAPPPAPGGPLDLVAGAAVPIPADQPLSSEPQQLLPEREQEIVAAAVPAAPVSPPHELVAREGCIALPKVADKDGDFKRNAAALNTPGICVTQQKFNERRRPWTMQTVSSGRVGPLWAVMHDDEDVAFDVAVQALNTYGGTLVTFETGGRRNQDGIDPNRNFSDDEIGCKKLGKSAAPRFSASFKKLIDPAQPIIALHNNNDGPVPTGGLGHVSMNTVPKDMRQSPSDEPDGPLAGDRALVLLAALEPVATATETRMDELSRKGINVVLEPVAKDRGDCSLSNYAVFSGHGTYLNVTVDADEGEKLRKILDALLASPAAIASSQ